VNAADASWKDLSLAGMWTVLEGAVFGRCSKSGEMRAANEGFSTVGLGIGSRSC
jgi:hypothetical protein